MCKFALRVVYLLSFILPFPSTAIKSRCLLQAGTAKQDSAEFTWAGAGHSFCKLADHSEPIVEGPSRAPGILQRKRIEMGEEDGNEFAF